jgi:hypothetical protein
MRRSDRSDNNKNSNRDKKLNNVTADSDKLVLEAIEVLKKVLLLKEDAEFNFKLIGEWQGRLEECDRNELSSIAEREKLAQEGLNLMGRIKVSLNELMKTDEIYDDLRIRVNKYYGKEVFMSYEKVDKYEEILENMNKLSDDYDNK